MRHGLSSISCIAIATASTFLIQSGDGGAGAGATLDWKLVYERYDARRGEGGTGLEIVTGSRPHELTIARERNSKESYLFPEWSPDGRHVAFHGRVGRRHGLFAIGADGGHRTLVTSDDASDFAWSPDSTRLAFVAGCDVYSPSDGLQGCADGRIEVAPRDGGPSRVVGRPTGGRARSFIRLQEWSPDGTRLLARVGVRGSERLLSVSVSGGPVLTLAGSSVEGGLGDASWSSDGSLVAYTRRCGENRIGDTFCDLAVMARDGGSKRILYPRGPDVVGPSSEAPTWIPGTTRLLVPLWGNGAHTRLVEARSGRSRIIAKSPRRIGAVSRDGTTVARLDRQIGRPDVVVLARPEGSVVARSKLRKVPSRNLSWGASLDYDLWLP